MTAPTGHHYLTPPTAKPKQPKQAASTIWREKLGQLKQAQLELACTRIDGCLVELPAPTASNLATQAIASKAQLQSYCRVTGLALQSAPALFDKGQPTISLNLHPIFLHSFTTLQKIDQLNPTKSHTQTNALMLAMLLSADTFGAICAIRHPLRFSELQILSLYPRIAMLTQVFYRLGAKERSKLLADLPIFDTRKLVTQDTKSRNGQDWLESLAALPTYFCNWLDTLTEELETHLAIGDWGTLESQAKEIATRLHLDASKDDRQARLRANLKDYWWYILLDVRAKFDLPKDWLHAMQSQTKQPTSTTLLAELHTYLVGLANFAASSSFTGYVPAIQYKNAALEVESWINQLNLESSLQIARLEQPANLATLAEHKMIRSSIQLVDDEPTIPATSLPNLANLANLPSLPALPSANEASTPALSAKAAALLANLENLAGRVQALEDTKLAIAQAKTQAWINKLD